MSDKPLKVFKTGSGQAKPLPPSMGADELHFAIGNNLQAYVTDNSGTPIPLTARPYINTIADLLPQFNTSSFSETFERFGKEYPAGVCSTLSVALPVTGLMGEAFSGTTSGLDNLDELFKANLVNRIYCIQKSPSDEPVVYIETIDHTYKKVGTLRNLYTYPTYNSAVGTLYSSLSHGYRVDGNPYLTGNPPILDLYEDLVIGFASGTTSVGHLVVGTPSIDSIDYQDSTVNLNLLHEAFTSMGFTTNAADIRDFKLRVNMTSRFYGMCSIRDYPSKSGIATPLPDTYSMVLGNQAYIHPIFHKYLYIDVRLVQTLSIVQLPTGEEVLLSVIGFDYKPLNMGLIATTASTNRVTLNRVGTTDSYVPSIPVDPSVVSRAYIEVGGIGSGTGNARCRVLMEFPDNNYQEVGRGVLIEGLQDGVKIPLMVPPEVSNIGSNAYNKFKIAVSGGTQPTYPFTYKLLYETIKV